MKNNIVSIVKVHDYDTEKVRQGIIDSLAPLGGMKSFVMPGQKVLLKPNLLAGMAPDKAVTTHPAVVAAVAQIVKEAGGIPFVGDSPGIGDMSNALKLSGIQKVIDELDITVADFTNEHLFECPENAVGKKINLAKAVADADVIISIPKLKTHVQMTMTCALKNQYGLVVGMQKGQYHFRFKERDILADLMVDINRILEQ